MHYCKKGCFSIKVNILVLSAIFRCEKFSIDLGLFGLLLWLLGLLFAISNGLCGSVFLLLGLFLIRVVLFVLVLGSGALVILEKLGVEREKGSTRHEVHLSLVLLALGFLLLDSLFELLLLGLGTLAFPLHEGFECHGNEAFRGQSSSLFLDLLLQGQLALIVGVRIARLLGLLVSLQDVSGGQHMSVGAVVALVGAHPVETIQVLLHSFDEVLARDDRVWLLANLRTRVRVNIDVRRLLIREGHIVRVLTLLTLLAHTSLEVTAKSLLVVNSCKQNQTES